MAQSHSSQLSRIKTRATGFGKLCQKPGLAWLFMAGFGWLKPLGQSWHITMHTMFFLEVLCQLAFESCTVAASQLNTGLGEGGKSGWVDSTAQSSMASVISESAAQLFNFLDATHTAFNLDEHAGNLAITQSTL
jgi:hypothetical protein